MVENNTSAEYNPDKNSDFEGYNSEDIAYTEPIVVDSDPYSSDIKVFCWDLVRIQVIILTFRMYRIIMDLTLSFMVCYIQ